MSKANQGTDVLSKIIAELKKLDELERRRVMSAAHVYFGTETPQSAGTVAPSMGTSGGHTPPRRPAGGAAAFFDQKQPKTKLEELAVAAKYREDTEDAQTSNQEQLRAVFGEARRHFDVGNFRRDIENAKVRGLFLRSGGRNEFQLSSDGQKVVDALPDRKAASALGGGRKRSKPKKKG